LRSYGSASTLIISAAQTVSIEMMSKPINWDVSAAQGMRPTMEDAHLVDQDSALKYGFWAVLDGHGGAFASDYASRELGPAVKESLFGSKEEPVRDDSMVAERISNAFSRVDDKLCKALRKRNTCDGSTCIAALVLDQKLFVANTGDSRCVCGMRDGSPRAMSWDQTCDRQDEAQRVQAAGGAVRRTGGVARINGELVPSRAFGDPEYKEGPLPHPVTAIPEVAVLDMAASPAKFAILACDGLWDVCTNEQAVSLVNRYLERGYSNAKIVKALVEHALREGSTDNVTAMVLLFGGVTSPGKKAPPRAAAVPMPRR